MKNSRKHLANSTNENHIYVKWSPLCDPFISYRYTSETYGLNGVHRESEGWWRLTISYLHHSDRTHMICLAIPLARTSYLSNYMKLGIYMEENTYMVEWWFPNLLGSQGLSEEPESLYFESFSGIYNDHTRLRHTVTENHNYEENTIRKTHKNALDSYIYLHWYN